MIVDGSGLPWGPVEHFFGPLVQALARQLYGQQQAFDRRPFDGA